MDWITLYDGSAGSEWRKPGLKGNAHILQPDHFIPLELLSIITKKLNLI